MRFFTCFILFFCFCLSQCMYFAEAKYFKENDMYPIMDRDLALLESKAPEGRGVFTFAAKRIVPLAKNVGKKVMESVGTKIVEKQVENVIEAGVEAAVGELDDSAMKDIGVTAATSVFTGNFIKFGKNIFKRVAKKEYKKFTKESIKHFAKKLRTQIAEEIGAATGEKIAEIGYEKLGELVSELMISDALVTEQLTPAEITQQRQEVKAKIESALGKGRLTETEMNKIVDIVMRAKGVYQMDEKEANDVVQEVEKNFKAEALTAELYDPIFTLSRFDNKRKMLTLGFKICSSQEIRDEIMSYWRLTQEEKENAKKRQAIQKISKYAVEEVVSKTEF